MTFWADGAIFETTTYSYEWWDSAKKSQIKLGAWAEKATWADGFSHFHYDVNGHLTQAIDEHGGRQIHYRTNAQGLILRREETAGDRFEGNLGQDRKSVV